MRSNKQGNKNNGAKEGAVGLKRVVLSLLMVACLAVIAGIFGVQVRGDTSATPSSFTVNINSFVNISISIDISTDDTSVDQADLTSRYFIGTSGFAHFSVLIYAISNYEVTATDTVTANGTPAPGGDYSADGLLEIRAGSFTNDDESCMVSTGWQEIPTTTTGNSNLVFSGCNTEGGTSNSSIANLDIRMDLDNLGDSNVNNSFTFVVTLNVTDPTS